jgi:hypothetical protein
MRWYSHAAGWMGPSAGATGVWYMQCPACGAENAQDAQFCSQCSAAIVGQPSEQSPPPEAAPVSEPVTTPETPAIPESIESPAVAEAPEARAPAATEPMQVGPPPVDTPPGVAPLETPEATPKKSGRIRLLVTLVVAFVAVVAIVAGAVLYMNSVASARTSAQAAVAKAETAIADADLTTGSGSDTASFVEEAKARLAEAKAKIASGTPFSAAPYHEAQSLAGEASTAAGKATGVLDAALANADSLRQSSDYTGAVAAWSELVKTYPRSNQADDARSAALDMLTSDVADDSSVAPPDDLQLSVDIAAMYPSDSVPTDLNAHVTTVLLDAANTELDTLQGITSDNASWATQIDRQGQITGDVVSAFENQTYGPSDVAWIQGIQAMIPKLGQPPEMARLYADLVETTSLASACKSIADNPHSSTSSSATFTAAQINAVRSNAGIMQRDIDDAKLLAAALAKST